MFTIRQNPTIQIHHLRFLNGIIDSISLLTDFHFYTFAKLILNTFIKLNNIQSEEMNNSFNFSSKESKETTSSPKKKRNYIKKKNIKNNIENIDYDMK